MRLAGKIAVVTGGSRGIGRAIALQLARDGAGVFISYLQAAEAAEAVVAEIRSAGGGAECAPADVRNLEDVRRLAEAAVARFGKVDILVNNAGILRDNYLTFMKGGEWADVIDTNLTGTFHGIKVFARDMARRKSGRIVNIASDAALLGDLMRANYAAAKAGVLGLTRTAAREFAASGITVNAVSPGMIETDMTRDLAASRREKQTAAVPQRRFGRPEEVAGAVAFLASDDAAYVTGEVLCVDGGLHM